MQLRNKTFLIPIVLGALILASVLILWSADQANAQCGSQASSCKNCHEVQGQDPVNADGTGWHTGHAFGDFCYICHAGNNQSMEIDAAHSGMVPPLSDVKASCQSCHPNDLMERAQVYATALGVEVGEGGAPASGAGTSGAAPAASAEPGSPAPAAESAPAPALVVTSDEVIDYEARYAENVQGVKPVNWGNVILVAMIVMVALGGGGYVYYNERKLRGLPLFPQAAKTVSKEEELPIPQIDGYTPEVLALLPKIARLNPIGLHALKRLLENPDLASEQLLALSRLDPELVRRIRNMDHEARNLLLALSGD